MEVMRIETQEQLLAGSFHTDVYSEEVEGDYALGREDDYDGGISNPNLWEQGW